MVLPLDPGIVAGLPVGIIHPGIGLRSSSLRVFLPLPISPTAERAFQIEYLKHFAPDLSHVTWQSFDANLYQYRYYNSWLLPKRALKKLSRILKGDRLLQRNWECSSFILRGAKAGELAALARA